MRGAALILVLLVLSALAIIGTPFVISMALHDKASHHFSGGVAARVAAEAARNHAIASLEKTVYAREFETEDDALESSRPQSSARSQTSSGRQSAPRASVRQKPRKNGLVVRRDQGEKVESPRERDAAKRVRDRLAHRAERAESDEDKKRASLPERYRLSKLGPSPREYDLPGETDTPLLDQVEAPGATTFRFQDSKGITASALVQDEQGKININTAPPVLIANLFAVSRLAEPFKPEDDRIVLEDASAFRGDGDEATIDGAVIIIRESGMEAVTYRSRSQSTLGGCFRGAFLSGRPNKTAAAGSFVYDLRGWKVGLHRFWAQGEGGFQPSRLARFRSVEAIREIANWQITSFFVSAFHSQGLTLELLEQSGWSPKKLGELGLDPAMFAGEGLKEGSELKAKLEEARRRLRRLGVSSALVERLKDARGARVVCDLAARLDGADKQTRERVEKSLELSLSRDKREPLALPPRYVGEALKNLAEVYKTPGIETIEPGELEWLHEVVTVDSHVPVEWLEAQVILEDEKEEKAGGASMRLAGGSSLSIGTTVRIRSLSDPSFVAFNQASASGQRGFGCFFSLPLSVRAFDAVVEGLARHPVNVNTASRRVLRAVFTGVDGTTPYQADQLAGRAIAARPFKGPDDYRSFLESLEESKVLASGAALALFANSVSPTYYKLHGSTTGFVYSTGDVYSIESRGIAHAPSGASIAEARFREIVEVSAPRKLKIGLITQADFAEGIYLHDAQSGGFLGGAFPEETRQFLLETPGTRGNLVASRPLLLPRSPLAVPGGDLGSLRLLATQTSEGDKKFTLGKVEHFEGTHEGWGLDTDDSWPVDMSLQGTGSKPQGPAPGASASGDVYLNMVSGGIEFWARFLTFPSARSGDGHVILFDAGAEEERNRIQLLYADRTGQILLRVYDASLRDPSVERRVDNGQYLEISAQKRLEVGVWYHFRSVWDGVFGGGAQLFIDGLPAGTDNLSTELLSAVPLGSGAGSLSVKDAGHLPRSGVVRIDQELFEYVKSGGNTLRIREEPASSWKPLTQRSRQRSFPYAPIMPPQLQGLGGGGAAAPAAASPQENPAGQVGGGGPARSAPPDLDLTSKRAPGNSRGSTPATHSPGARVSLHGYSLEVRRKIRNPTTGQEKQLDDADGKEIVWGQSGLGLKGALFAFNFPVGVQGLCHYEPATDDGGGEPFIVPLYFLDGASETSPVLPTLLTGVAPGGGDQLNAADYFQERGVCVIAGQAFLYKKEKTIPAYYSAAQGRDGIVSPQTQGLRLLGTYPPLAAGNWPKVWTDLRARWRFPGPPPMNVAVFDLVPRSVEATGKITGLYPPTGILEIQGTPAPWEKRAARKGPLFSLNPDDAVEWIRYVEVFDRPFAGEDFHLFVGRTAARASFRGYPERPDPALSVDYRKQLNHDPGAPLRLVMELSEGGAGWGDYVSISGRDPASGRPIYEPESRRVYKVLEHEDGRFFASLVAVDSRGEEIHGLDRYRNSYTMAMSPRLVKFPTWGLPEMPAAVGLLAGDSLEKSSGASGSASPSGRASGSTSGRIGELEEDEWPITFDEIRRIQTSQLTTTSKYTTRHVLVPLKGKRVDLRSTAQSSYITGTIPAELNVSRSSPLEVLIVTLSRERGALTLFAQGKKEGLLRVGEELFYFEDLSDDAQGGLNSAQAKISSTQPQDPNQANTSLSTADFLRERNPLSRSTLVDIPIASTQGRFEEEGFVRLEDLDPERSAFHEVFYYQKLGGGFSRCLRGQFATPIAQNTTAGTIRNATRRVRLIGRSLLGSRRTVHSLGEAVSLVPLGAFQPVTGAVSNTGLPVKKADVFDRSGALLLDSGEPGRPWEIIAYLGASGEGLLRLARDEHGRGILRGRFGTPELALGQGLFAYELPHRYPDRYEPEVESESLAYLQKSFRIPGAYWRSIEWLERASHTLRQKRSDVVVLARFDGKPDWDAKPTNSAGGLYLLQKEDGERQGPTRGELGCWADQLECRIYFRFPAASFSRLPDGRVTDDWKETAILDGLWIEYEKAGTLVRHEELPF